MKRRIKTLVAPAALIATIALSACGVGTEDVAREIPLPPGYTRTATAAPSASGPYLETLCLVRDGTLVPVQRKANRQPTVTTLIRDLAAGPTDSEVDGKLTSSLLGTDVIADVIVHDGVAKVALADTIEDTGRTDEIAALGQIVCTLTRVPGITGVQFTRDGQIVKVPRADASLTTGPLTAADYQALISPSPTR